jgi:propionyl-CoA carboxylase alpha chain
MARTERAVFRSVLVANRGEIARRVLRSCRELGLGTVAVYADDDEQSPHVGEADAAVRLPGNSVAETYLRPELLIEAARRAAAEAVHPGYGLLSEKADFARAVQAAGLVWIGPPPQAMQLMGSKIEAKRLMAAAGVAVLAELDLHQPPADAEFPLLIKASSGGGGRGMRIVRTRGELDSQLAGARAEALAAFGDDTVFGERYLPAGRHIEVQVLADQHGTVWAVGERECSIQRRHQKVLEEAPSPLVERVSGMRERLFAAATAATRAVDYVGAGTVEFLADEDGTFFFLEMNTRIQVEHPVTECVTGLDLVRLQLQVAAGVALPDGPPASAGSAMEVRLYAEDPARNWLPQSGTLHRLEIPAVSGEFGPLSRSGLRLDSGVRDGSVVGVRYDPMLAKLISWAPDRDQAASMLAAALARAQIHGLRTNRDLLVRILRHPAFLAGDTDTGFFDRHGLLDGSRLAAPLADRPAQAVSALAAALSDAAANRAEAAATPSGTGRLPSGWRNVVSQPQRKSYRTGEGDQHDVDYRLDRNGLHASGFADIRLLSATANQVVLELAGVRRQFQVARYPGLVCVDSALGGVDLIPVERFPDPSAQPAAGSLVAPMPGSIVRIAVQAGDPVMAGQPLLWLEAMKMEHPIAAPAAGTVAALPVAVGQQVELGDVLAVLELAVPELTVPELAALDRTESP